MLSEYLTFGITKKGEWVFIDEVGRGSPELYCPFCKSLLIANKGIARTHYFSHQGVRLHKGTKSTTGNDKQPRHIRITGVLL